MPDQPQNPLDPPPVTPPPAAGPRRPSSRPTVDNTWTQEDEDRYQAQRQRAEARAKVRRRQGLSFFAIVLIVVVIGLVGAAVNQGVIKFGTTSTPCPTPEALPQPGEITVNIFNGTSQRGLAGKVSADLAARGYKIGEVGNAPDELRNFPDPVQLHHGPDGEDAAKVVAVQVAGATSVLDEERTNGSVDLVIGQAYTTLVAPEEATKALAPAPVESPAGCTPAT